MSNDASNNFNGEELKEFPIPRIEGETDSQYYRFCIYCWLNSERSVQKAYEIAKTIEALKAQNKPHSFFDALKNWHQPITQRAWGGKSAKAGRTSKQISASTAIHDAARAFNWPERAKVYDDLRLGAYETQRRNEAFKATEEYYQEIKELQQIVFKALKASGALVLSSLYGQLGVPLVDPEQEGFKNDPDNLQLIELKKFTARNTFDVSKAVQAYTASVKQAQDVSNGLLGLDTIALEIRARRRIEEKEGTRSQAINLASEEDTLDS